MGEEETLFRSPSEKAQEKRLLRKGPTFTPFIVAAILLVIAWGVLTFVLPTSPGTLPASTILKNTLRPLVHDDAGTERHQ